MKRNQKWTIPLPARILLAFLGMWLVGTFSLGYFFTRALEKGVQEKTEQVSAIILRNLEQRQELLFVEARWVADRADVAAAVAAADRAELLRLLLPIRTSLALDWVKIVMQDGSVLVSLYGEAIVSDKLQDREAINAARDGLDLSDIVVSDGDAPSLLVGLTPVKSQKTVLGGVIVGTAIDMELLGSIRASPDQHLVVFHQGQAIASTLPSAAMEGWKPPDVQSPPSQIIIAGSGYMAKSARLSGATISGIEIVLLNPLVSLKQEQQHLWLAMGAFCLGGAAIALLLGFWLRNSITRRIQQLIQATQALATGDLTVQIPVMGDDEVGQLARSFEFTIAQLESRDRQLEDALANLRAIINNLADGLVVTDIAGRIVRFNPALLTLLGLKGSDLEGKFCQDVFEAKLAAIEVGSREQPTEVLTAEIELADNHIGQASATAISKTTSADLSTTTCQQNCIGSAILIRDVTNEKEIDRMKTDFIATVSHELRTPLTSVLGFADAIKDRLETKIVPAFSADDRKMHKILARMTGNLDIIISESERLTAIINDVLDIAKMESGKMDWQMQPVAIQEAIERARMTTASLAKARGLLLRQVVEPNLPDVMGDRDRIMQVLINLLSNAIKFTEEGAVTCRARRRDNEVLVSVMDTGIGIHPQQQEQVFERFKQVGDVLKDKPKGTGLGLPICKQIVEHHGGEIWVESEPGQGSTFSFTLPVLDQTKVTEKNWNIATLVQQLRDRTATSTASPLKEKANILVVDDDNAIRELLRQSLEAEGYIIREARDGVEAIQQVKRNRPDLILLDVMMPQINGFEVAAVLKNDPQTADIPIIILSIVEDRERGFRLGVDRYLTKPINRSKLLKEIGTLLSQGSSNKKVLVVDRNASTLAVLSEALQAQGYTVVEALGEEECIEKALSHEPDLIIIDSVLSEQQNLVKTLRFEKGLEKLCFILLSENTSDRENL